MNRSTRTSAFRFAQAGVLAAALAVPFAAHANHPVLVEGEQDFDGDLRVGIEEDMDGPDGDPLGLTFGTIGGCLGSMNAAINQNGTCTVVTSGTFAEVVNITGSVTLEAAPGVRANIDAFLAPPDPLGNVFNNMMSSNDTRLNAPGIIINVPDDGPPSRVIIRNITTQNWTDGVLIMGNSNVLLDGVEATHNTNHGINVTGNAVVAIVNSSATANGFRRGGGGVFPSADGVPMPGVGIRFQDSSRGEIRNSTATGNFSFGIANQSTSGATGVTIRDTTIIGNFPGDPNIPGARAFCRAQLGDFDRAESVCFQFLVRSAIGLSSSAAPTPVPMMMNGGM